MVLLCVYGFDFSRDLPAFCDGHTSLSVTFSRFIHTVIFWFFVLFCFFGFIVVVVVVVFLLFRVTLVAYGSSQARGGIGAAAASLRHSHSNAGSELCLPSTPQLLATLDPEPTERGQGSNPHPHGYSSGL